MNSLVLLSGGLDSTTLLAQAIEDDGRKFVETISFAYPSLHNRQELFMATKIAQHYDVPHHIVKVPGSIFQGSDSALLGNAAMPEGEYPDMRAEGPATTAVPFRNGLFISLAAVVARSRNLRRIYIATHADDHASWAYPDCSPEFLGAMANALYVESMGNLGLLFPFVWMSKADIVARGTKLNVPYHLTRSCYQDGEIACGLCPTCIDRLAAFEENGIDDPVRYPGE